MTMTLGKGVAIAMSSKQKLNTRSSTEAELVALDDSIGMILWTKRFLEAQGYKGVKHVIDQDNQSTLKLAKNGRTSAGKRTRHMNVRYFYITDQVDKGYVTVEYRPTKQMTSDYMTKPLQGALMRHHHRTIMNY